MALALALLAAAGWVNMPFTNREELRSIRWSMPENSTSLAGLGGGITFAISDDFCSLMVARFSENYLLRRVPNPLQFVSCEDINDSIKRAMNTWSDNSAFIKFVTTACDTSRSDRRKCTPELLISTSPRTSAIGERVAAFVLHQPEGGMYGRQPITTAGVVARDELEITQAELTFVLDVCWFMDPTFCSQFHLALVDFASTTTVVRMILLLSWIIAAVVFAFRVGKYLTAYAHGGWDGISVEMDRTEAKLWHSLFMIFFLITPPAFYFFVYLPCIECYDFESAMTHELGHVLGFAHPDEFPDVDRMALKPLSLRTCKLNGPADWLASKAVGYIADQDDDVLPSRPSDSADSVMYSLTTFRSRSCLTDNDLDGLNYLYPSCDKTVVRQPPSLCVKAQRNIGWLRLAATIAIPFVAAVASTIATSQLLNRRLRRRASSLRLQEAVVRTLAQRRIWDMERNERQLLSQNKLLKERRAASGASAVDSDAGTGLVMATRDFTQVELSQLLRT
ncbi:hypothetical protein KFE25_005572 [Diacronema lutheri]|uniref:Peptidase M10 metallopeptidase domain-containing protein n=2 Tax=Diacronema lutheri TaxID=2081491 RepID=A0A8J5XKA6_DIALT|nr:hypothetical protein KFE25_005572 [Diacronema lutheri]